MKSENTWIFDKAPASGSRQGGDPAFHAFEHNIETFTREVLQNSNDQRIKGSSKPVEVTFELINLSGRALKSFKKNIDWAKIRKHFSSVLETKEGRQELEDHIKRIKNKQELLLLKISDYQTQGLQGAESGEDSNFTALCKDKLYSHKDSESAGGTYGLGKSVLWGFSGLSTVLFNSYLSQETKGKTSPRIIGRAELPSHQMKGDWYNGSGWFGSKSEVEGGLRAESVWGDDAENLAKKTHLDRDPEPGTTILIPGFTDPTSSSEKSQQEYINEINRATCKYFWPSMLEGAPKLRVNFKNGNGKTAVNPAEEKDTAPFIDCYESFLTGAYQEKLEEPGDIVCKDIEVDIPDKVGGSTAKTSATLCVRLAPEDSTSGLVNNIAYFRGSGMVVKYKNPRTSISARPFHAVVITGVARDLDNPSKGDRDLEEFLRAAEPPAHQDWKSTKKLKNKYKRGYSKALRVMKNEIKDELSEIIRPEIGHGEEGPDKLRKRFDIFSKGSRSGGKGGPERPKEKISVRNFDSEFIRDEGRWIIGGLIGVEGNDHEGWEVELNAITLGEDGSKQQEVPFNSIETDKDKVMSKIEGETAVFAANDGTSETNINILTKPVVDLENESIEEVGELYIELEGRVFREE